MAVALAVGKDLDELHGAVRAVEVGEHEHVRTPRHGALALDLLRSHGGDDGGVKLELAVEGKVGPAVAGDRDRLADALDAGALAGAVGRVADKGAARLPVHEGRDVVARGDGDGGQLLGGGLGVEAAVGESNHVALGALEARRLDKCEDGGHVNALGEPDDHLGCHEHVSGRVGVAAERAVHVAQLLEHHGVVQRVLELAAGGLCREEPLAAGVHVALGECVCRLGVCGVHDAHALGRDARALRRLGDDVCGAHEDRRADAVVRNAPRGQKGVLVFALGKRHHLGGLARLLDELVNKCHGLLRLSVCVRWESVDYCLEGILKRITEVT